MNGHLARAEALLSWFTASARAQAIVGDLAERGALRGPLWFWLHLLGTACVLFRAACASAPLPVVGLAALGSALFITPTLAGAAAVSLFPTFTGSTGSWLVFSLFCWSGALWAGASLVGIAPGRGMVACALLVLAGELLLVGFGLMALSRGGLTAPFIMFSATGLVAAAPLLAGGAVARSRLVVRATPVLDPHR